jgi:hypothetical protein
MRLLLDTHAFIWFVLNDPQLSRTADALITDPTKEFAAITATASLPGRRGSVRAARGTWLARRLARPKSLSGARAEYNMPGFPVAPIRPTCVSLDPI